MLKAFSLVYALLVALLIAAICSALVLYQHLYKFQLERHQTLERLVRNSHSGMELLLAESSALPSNSSTVVDLFGEKRDSVQLSQRSWGMLELCSATAFQQGRSITRTAFIGRKINRSKTALYLADRDKPLALCGRTTIKGEAYLPQAGVKRAYIEGQTFIGQQLIDGRPLQADRSLPPLLLEPQEVRSQLQKVQETDSLVYWSDWNEAAHHQPWERGRLIIESPDWIELDQPDLSGQVVIRSETGISIGSNCRLEDVLIQAPEIVIEQGFEGQVQAFATANLTLEPDVTLEFPSILVALHETGGPVPIIDVQEEVRVSGLILLQSTGYVPGKQPRIQIDPDALITGQIYAEGQLDLKGTVHGQVYCEEFYLATPSATYRNHLLNGTIDRTALSENYVGIDLLENSGSKALVKWL